MRRQLLRCIALAAHVSVFSACGSSEVSAPAVVSVTGTWNLSSVNGKPLPFIFQAADPKLELLSKQYVIGSGGSFSYSYSVRATDDDGTVTTSNRTDTGTETLADNVVTLHHNADGATLTASVAGGTMTILAGDYSQVFVKQ